MGPWGSAGSGCSTLSTLPLRAAGLKLCLESSLFSFQLAQELLLLQQLSLKRAGHGASRQTGQDVCPCVINCPHALLGAS